MKAVGKNGEVYELVEQFFTTMSEKQSVNDNEYEALMAGQDFKAIESKK